MWPGRVGGKREAKSEGNGYKEGMMGREIVAIRL